MLTQFYSPAAARQAGKVLNQAAMNAAEMGSREIAASSVSLRQLNLGAP